ncbi:hypothetical protein AVEN_62254-1 [Araneus ventricosus]|uniref:RNase NYN domain-containing protein n=1 Tax=Araneus ventricosus TaxID=182803 RepID=A0A4Y2EB25_ARAVE|nr:hypothetical protein AVEN_62254-1 [Araneus ventricosus]
MDLLKKKDSIPDIKITGSKNKTFVNCHVNNVAINILTAQIPVPPSHTADHQQSLDRNSTIVIDGNDVGLQFGGGIYFDWLGIYIALNKLTNYKNTVAFVPDFRRNHRFGARFTINCHLISELEARGKLVYTPNPNLEERRVLLHNSFILDFISKNESILISNAHYLETHGNSLLEQFIKQKTVNYLFVGQNFITSPANPNGRNFSF